MSADTLVVEGQSFAKFYPRELVHKAVLELRRERRERAKAKAEEQVEGGLLDSESGPGPLQIKVRARSVLGYNLECCRIPLVESIVVHNRGERGFVAPVVEIEVHSTLQQAPVGTWQQPLTALGVGAEDAVERPELVLDLKYLAQLDESVRGELVVRVVEGGMLLGECRAELKILAYSQWVPIAGAIETLAAFVMPNHPAIEQVRLAASEILMKQTGSSSQEGYQAGAERALQLARANYEALVAQQIRYSNPPASSEEYQKIRTPDRVLGDRFGTCLDTACLMASCLQQAGLNPVLLAIPGHALVAVWLEDGRGIGLDRSKDFRLLLTAIDSGLLVPIETTMLAAEPPGGFDDAVAEGRKRVLATDKLLGAIDVSLAHRQGVRPLPSRVFRDGKVEILVRQEGAVRTEYVGARVFKPAAGPRLPMPPRFAAWQSQLLDMSLRNPLLNLKVGRGGGIKLVVPRDTLHELEAQLARGRELSLVAHDGLTDLQKSRGARLAREVLPEELTGLLRSEKILFAEVEEARAKGRFRKLIGDARSAEQETGSNVLYLVLGVLAWQDPESKRAVRSPLLLLPVRVRSGGRGKPPILVADAGSDGTQVNQCLLQKLRQAFRLEVPELASWTGGAEESDLRKPLEWVRQAILRQKLDMSVEEDAALCVLQFGKFRMWKDYDEHWEDFYAHPVVKHLIDHAGQTYEGGEAMPTTAEVEQASPLCPIPCDGSQLEAVVAAAKGCSFVLEGPPGTGKSQTITNLIANALAEGKKLLFVAEKRAALDVVKARLTKVGLAAYCLDIHGKKSTPLETRKQLTESLEASFEADEAGYERQQQELLASEAKLREYAQAVHAENSLGYSMWTANQAELRLGEGWTCDVLSGWFAHDKNWLDALLASLRGLPDAVRIAQTTTGGAWAFVTEADESRLDLPELQRAVEELAKAMAVATAAEPAQLIDGATQAGELRAMEELLAAQDAGFGWRLEALRRSLASGWSQAVDAVVADARKLTEEGAQLVRHLDLGVLDADIGALREGLDRARNSFFLFRKGKVRAAMAMVAPWLSDPEATPERVSAALGVAQRVQTLGARLVKQLGDLLGVAPEARAYVTDGALAGRLNEFLQALGRGRDLLLKGGPELAHLVELPADVRDRLRTRARWLADGWERLGRACRVDAAVFGAWQAGRPVVACVGAAIKDWQLAAQRGAFLPLLRWCRVLSTYRALHEAGLDKVVEAVKDGSLAPQDAATAVERSLAKACMEERLATTGLGRFDGASHGVEVGKYVTLNEGRSFLLTEVLPQRMLGKRPWKPGQRFGQVAELYSQELNRQKGGRSIRALLSEFPDAIMALTPCVLASPESVAQFLSIKKLRFDIVVFDEASQVRVAEAIGAIARGRSLVVVGDSRQMPPTEFFARGKVSDEAEGSAVAVEETVDLESILTEVAENAGLPRLWLSWHYRSQDESLIAFSNRHYYEDKLASFPAPSSQLDGMGVSLIEVTDGVFDSGETRTNEAEARAVLEEVLRRVRDPREAKRSIGIVTMNLQQADLMRELLEEAAADEPGLQAILDSEEEDSLFIKNLENVQGDERDAIIISLTYAKNREGRLAMNFGPLNRLGGERRWNVLVTRARQQVVVVSSMQPEEIRLQDVSRLAKGVHHMRAYLEMAKRGADRGQVSRLRIAEAVDLHRDQIAAALRQLGWTVDVGVGLSSFKVDLAIAHPDHGERRVAAILLDGPGYAKRRTVQDRDGLPAAVLRQMMKWPTVLRVWLPEWVLERERVLDQLHAAIEAAKQGVDERLSAAAEGAASVFVAVGSGKADAVGEPKPQWGSAPGGFKPKKSEPVTPAAAVDPEPTAPAALRSNGVDDVSQVSATPVQHRDPEDLDYVAYPGGVVLGTKENLSPGCSGLVQNAIRKAIDDVLAVEAPIRIDLLAKHVARRFGLSKVHSDRAQVVIDLVDRALVSKSLGETFVWSRQVEAATWRAFRRTTEAFRKDRQLDEVAPEEILNAVAYAAFRGMGITDEGAIEQVADVFGCARTKGMRKRVEDVVNWGLSVGRLVRDAGGRLAADAPGR